MNLHYDNNTESLAELIQTADTTLPTHNIAIDFDGEVIIDPEKWYPNVDVNLYKFTTRIKDNMLRRTDVVKVLLEALMTVFETHNKYSIDYSGDMNMAA